MSIKTFVLCNPLANQGNAKKIIDVLRPLTSGDQTITWHETQYYQHSLELTAQAIQEQAQRIVAIGGDGTIHEVVNGLMRVDSARRPSLGIVPVGSGNDFAKALAIPANPQAALQTALGTAARPIDIGLIQDETGRSEYWTNSLGIGFDAIVNIRSRQVTYARGFGIYLIAALQTILYNHNPIFVQAEEDGRIWQDRLIMMVIGNGRREGGAFWIAPEAHLNDGLLDYATVQRISRLQMLLTIPHFMRGTHTSLKYISTGRFKRLQLTANLPLRIHTDGEIYAGMDSRLQKIVIESVPGAVQIALSA